MDPTAVGSCPGEGGEVDYAASSQSMERHLAECGPLNEAQRRNARRKALDLYEERLVWESVPFRVLWEFNRRCNVQCVHCDIPREGTGDLPIELFERFLDETQGGVWEIMPLLGGEPTLAPIQELSPLIRQHNLYWNFITNGIRFTRDYFDPIADVTSRVQFSLHSHRRELHERIMPSGSYDQVIENLSAVVELSRETETHVVPCIVALDLVMDDMPGYIDFLADLGVTRTIIQKLYPKTERYEELEPTKNRTPDEMAEIWAAVLERARDRGIYIETNVAAIFEDPDNVPRVKSVFDLYQENVGIVDHFNPGFCMSTAVQALVEWDGTVVPCCKDHIVLGNLKEQSFGEVWNGPESQELRRTFFERDLRPYCKLCKNFYLGHP